MLWSYNFVCVVVFAAVRIAVNVSFNQTLYNTSETDESAQITLILSNPLSTDIAVEVFNTNITACGKCDMYKPNM